ncbi:6ae744e1-aad0-4211-80e7-a9bb5969124f [Sclerotinia trifoliorum]|uniref:6ae744e1-aad0-4211-80e7-a9bb5969124f n=1 Tax=Sclerotinia trifoliorum TaxID=28548 RepID=A0A8H2ZSX2_9HELO|nr:6ae744e1-aad0-4211-80e7-a9bb5969124f [Sclerotinia trifoliorum]
MTTPASSTAGTTFADATKVQQLTSHTYSANFPDDWCIGTVPHGGFITGVFLQVSTLHFRTTLSAQNQPNPIILHLEFLRRTQVGPAIFTVQDTKIGRQTSILHITLSQGDRVEVVGYITHSNTTTEEGASSPHTHVLKPAPLPVSLPLLKTNTDPNYHLRELAFSNFRKATKKGYMYLPRTEPSPNISDEWIRLSTGEYWTNESLAFACDMFAIPTEIPNSLNTSTPTRTSPSPYPSPSSSTPAPAPAPVAKYWFPTLVLNIDFKKSLPQEGIEWLFIRVERKQIKNGRMDIELTAWDETGELVAISNHVALVVGLERNTAERGSSKI